MHTDIRSQQISKCWDMIEKEPVQTSTSLPWYYKYYRLFEDLSLKYWVFCNNLYKNTLYLLLDSFFVEFIPKKRIIYIEIPSEILNINKNISQIP